MSLKSSARIKHKRRPGDPWVSNNRVLNSQSSLVKNKNMIFGRNPNFDTDETKLLIQLWGDPKVQRTLITTHKKHAVICQLASRMEEYGYYRSPEEITTRIKNLKCFYNRLKKELETGQSLEPSWKHFAEMDAIMTRPIFSVRPNEVPAPSLKYQKEKEKEERAERKQKKTGDDTGSGDNEDGVTESESEDFSAAGGESKLDPNDDGIIPDMEVDIDVDMNKALEALASAADHTQRSGSEAGSTKRKMSKCSDDMSDYEGEPERTTQDDEANVNDKDDDDDELIIKEEKLDTIDVDDEEFSKEINTNNNQQKDDPAISSETQAYEQRKECDELAESADTSAALVIPKDEPIELDDESSSVEMQTISLASNVKNMMPTLAEILQMTKSNIAISSASIMMPMTSISSATNVIASNFGSTTTTSSASMLTTSQAGKISLVPTNFLMQPKSTATGTINSLTQPSIISIPNTASGQLSQPRLVINGDASAALQCAPNTGIVATGPNGMKVLLVNAEQAAAAGIRGGIQLQTLNAPNLIQTQAPQATQQQQQQQQQQKQQQQQVQQQQQAQQQQQQQQQKTLKKQLQQEKERETRFQAALHKQQSQRRAREERERTRREEMISKKEATGMRILLRQLLNAQTESNDIHHQRLAMERERLDFEKSAVERLFTALPTFFAQQQQQQQLILQQQQQQQQQLLLQQQKLQQQQQLQLPAQQHFITHAGTSHAVGGQLRLSNPPKLLFTTTLPTKSQAATLLSSTNTLTTSLPKSNTVIASSKPIEICTQINDLQMISPKVETADD